MKKILRLVTTSVLTLTLVACGEASSSVSSTDTGNGSVSSVSSAYANVTSVTLSAATATLTQVMGAQKRVTVTAALNANTNPNLTLEWYVNGVKQAQTSRIFDFTPTEVGSFAIQAKIGNLSSNTLTVALGLPVFAVESLVFETASQLIMKAPAGASVTLTGAELADTSRYDLVNEEYVLDLEEAVTQGTTVTVRLEKEGSQPLVETVIYDTRTFTLDEVTFGIGANVEELSAVDGVFTVEKPIDKGAAFVRTYKIAFDATDLFPATGTVAFTKELTVPSGATAVATTTANIQNLSSTVSEFEVKNDSAVGLYTHKFTLGGKVVEVKVNVVEQTPTIELLPAFVFKNTTTKANELVEFVVDKVGNENHTPIKLGADGVYEVTKPFTTFNPATPGVTNTFNFEFIFHAFGFPIVENFDNSFSVGLNGPIEAGSTITSVLSGVFTENTTSRTANSTAVTGLTSQAMTGTTAETLVIALNDTATTSTLHANASSSTSAIAHVNQIIDRGSPEGVYTFTIKAGQLGKEISKEVKVRLVEPKASVDFVVAAYESTNRRFVVDRSVTDTITIERPLGAAVASLEWYTILRNYQSPVATIAEINADALVTDAEDKQTFSSSTTQTTPASYEVWGASTSSLSGVGTNTFKFVDYSLTVTGPSNLITNLEARKAAMILTANTDTVIMVEGLSAGRQTTVETALGDAGSVLETGLQVDALLPAPANTGDELIDQVGLNRNPLTINSSVVSGTYTIKFIVGDLSKTLTLNIVEPKATIFTKNGVQADGTPIVASGTNKFQTTGAGYSRLLTGQDATNAATDNTIAAPYTVSWTALSSGKYTIYQKDKNRLSVNSDMFIADMPAGTYNYNIVKKYPDGRAETFADTVTISALDVDGVATIATNAKFTDAFNISEFDMETGVYEYSFTVGSLTREFVVEVLENRKVKLGTLTLGTSKVTFYNGMYRIPATGNGTITPRTIKVDVELVNLLETSFYGVVRSAPSAGFSVAEVDEVFTKATLAVGAAAGTVATGFNSLKGLTTLDLGKLSAATLVEGDNIVYTITFYNRTVEYGVASFAVTGETIVLTLTADDGVAATQAP